MNWHSPGNLGSVIVCLVLRRRHPAPSRTLSLFLIVIHEPTDTLTADFLCKSKRRQCGISSSTEHFESPGQFGRINRRKHTCACDNGFGCLDRNHDGSRRMEIHSRPLREIHFSHREGPQPRTDGLRMTDASIRVHKQLCFSATRKPGIHTQWGDLVDLSQARCRVNQIVHICRHEEGSALFVDHPSLNRRAEHRNNHRSERSNRRPCSPVHSTCLTQPPLSRRALLSLRLSRVGANPAMSARERPILFNGVMMCAILSGGTTQTRRAIKDQPVLPTEHWGQCRGQWMATGTTCVTSSSHLTWGWTA